MKLLRNITVVILIVLTGFLSLTGLLGGLALMAGFNSPPLEQLRGSVFNDFLVPGMVLFVIVGGTALLAFMLLVRKNKFAALFSTVAGIVIMFFEFVEVLAIGSPPGVARTLQIFYVGLGTLITVFSISIWYIDIMEITRK
jgi:hypothetical protein